MRSSPNLHRAFRGSFAVWCAVAFTVLTLNQCAPKPDDSQLFTKLFSGQTQIDFSNDLKEDETFNIIEYLYFYNGGGVAVGDINNDGWVDVYFSSNQGSNKLYLNKGNWTFEDITDKAGARGLGNWKTGVTMADVNGDGLLDIYLSVVGKYKKFEGTNQLLINNGDLTFSDRAKEFGLDFQGLSTQAAFFDYDRDGDLDCYLLNHSVHSTRSYGSAKERMVPDTLGGDVLYRQDRIIEGNDSSRIKFVDVSREAGIYQGKLGYGLGINTSDLNMDGFPDIYVSNDFQENDYLYLNQRDGTFKEISARSFGHTSRFSMGNDVADINNDLLPDVITLDMLPSQEDVLKTSAGDDQYEIYKFKLNSGFHFQTARNCLQLNRVANDSSVLFSDIAILAGVEATDWSWSPLLADFDNDGYKDLFVSNGIFRRPNDMDYINFISNEEVQKDLQVMNKSDLTIIDKMPSGKVSNFIFKNNGDLTFEDKTTAWGMQVPSLSSGAAYADLDNDGDLDLVVNNLNEETFLYRNDSQGNNHLVISAKGASGNSAGLGAKIIAYAGNQTFYNEISATRSFCSSVDTRAVIGLGDRVVVDSLFIIWPNQTFQRLADVKSNQSLVVEEQNAAGIFNLNRLRPAGTLFKEDPTKISTAFKHRENNYNAFNHENLMPQMLANEGPPMAVGDVNGDHLDDLFIGGGKGQAPMLFKQEVNGEFTVVAEKWFLKDSIFEDVDAAFFDADQDGDSDLVVVSGGQEVTPTKEGLRPRLYINNGVGQFEVSSTFPAIFLNASCVKPNDFDKDGDIDLFIGASTMPLLYGMSPISFLLTNDSHGNFIQDYKWLGNSTFANLPPDRPGMVKDAAWSDVNKDGLTDLILVGEWMPVTVLEQQSNHQFLNKTNQYGLQNTSGWWNTISTADMDKDGDDDFIVGNMGLNSRLTASPSKPLKMILGDLDGNGSSDHILVYFNGEKSYPFASRDQLVKQLPYLKKKFLKYSDYKNVQVDDIVNPAQKSQTTELKIEELRSVLIRNDGNKMSLLPLPTEAQFAPTEAIYLDDINEDGNIDILLAGNLSTVQTELGPYDASLGLVILTDGKNNLKPLTTQASGFVVRGEARDIEIVRTSRNGKRYMISRNNNSIVSFRTN